MSPVPWREWIVRLSFFLLIFLLVLLIRILSEFSRRSAHWKYQVFYGMDQSLDKYHLVTYKFTGQHYIVADRKFPHYFLRCDGERFCNLSDSPCSANIIISLTGNHFFIYLFV